MDSERLTLTPEDEKIIKKQAFRSAFCGAGLSTPVAPVLVFGAAALILSYFHNLTHVITPWIITVFAISVLPPIAYGAFCLESAKKFNRSEYWFSLVSRVNTHITDDTPLSDLTPLVSVGSPESNGGVAVALGVAISAILYDNLKKVADKLNVKIVDSNKVYFTTLLILSVATLIINIPFISLSFSYKTKSAQAVTETMCAIKESTDSHNRYFSSSNIKSSAGNDISDYHNLIKSRSDTYYCSLYSDKDMADSNVLMNLTINEYGEINSGFITYTFSEHITPEENIDNMIELFTEFNTILRESNVPMKSNDLIDYYIPSDEFLEMFRDNLHSAQRKNSFSIKENRRVFYDYSNRNAYSSGTSTTSRETITIHYNLYL